MRANMTPHYAAKLHDVEIESDAMTSVRAMDESLEWKDHPGSTLVTRDT